MQTITQSETRRYGLRLIADGMGTSAIARLTGVDPRTVRRWRTQQASVECIDDAPEYEMPIPECRRLQESRALAMLARAASPSEVEAETGLARQRAWELQCKHRLRPRDVARKSKSDLDRFRAKHERTHQELRDLRKRDKWQQLAIQFTYTAYDLLPESVWSSLLAGETVEAAFAGRQVDRADQQYTLWLDEDQRAVMREPIAVRESCELDDDVSDDPKAQLNRYGRALREEMYGA